MKQPQLTTPSDISLHEPLRRTLPNGVTIHTLCAAEFEVVRVSCVFRAGPAQQRKAFVATSTANLLSEGTRDMTSQQIAEQFDFYGSYFDVNVDRDYVYISFCSLSKYFRQTLAVAEQILLHPLFPEEEVAAYREKRKQRLRIERMKVETEAREAFARVAKELLRQNRVAEAVELLDLGLERMPTSQVRFTDTNTYPFLEAYYAASAMGDKEAAAKGDALLREYAQTLIEYIEHYLRFEGAQGDMVSGLIDEKLDQLGDIYYLASYADRKEVVAELNDYYRSLGVSEENLIDVGDKRQQPDSALLPAAK